MEYFIFLIGVIYLELNNFSIYRSIHEVIFDNQIQNQSHAHQMSNPLHNITSLEKRVSDVNWKNIVRLNNDQRCIQ